MQLPFLVNLLYLPRGRIPREVTPMPITSCKVAGVLRLPYLNDVYSAQPTWLSCVLSEIFDGHHHPTISWSSSLSPFNLLKRHSGPLLQWRVSSISFSSVKKAILCTMCHLSCDTITRGYLSPPFDYTRSPSLESTTPRCHLSEM